MEDKNNKNDVTAKLVVNKAADYLTKITERSNDNEGSALGRKTLETLMNVDDNTERTSSLLSSMKSSMTTAKQSSSPAKSLIRTDETGEGAYKNKSLKLLENIDAGIKNMGDTGIGGMLMGALGLIGSMFPKVSRLLKFATKMIKGIFKFGKNPLKFLKTAFVDFFSFIKAKFLKVIEGLLSFIPKPLRDLGTKAIDKVKNLLPGGAKRAEAKALEKASARELASIQRGARGHLVEKSEWSEARKAKRLERSNLSQKLSKGMFDGKVPEGFKVTKEGKIFKAAEKEAGFVGKTVGKVTGGVGKVTGGISKGIGKVTGGIGKLLGKGAGKVASTAVGKVASKGLAKVASKGLVKGGLKALGSAAKFIPGLGEAVAIGMMAFDAVDGWNNAAKILGKKEADIKTMDKVKAAGASVLSGLTFGIIDAETFAKWMGKIADWAEEAGAFIWDKIKMLAGMWWDAVKWVGGVYKKIGIWIWDKIKMMGNMYWDGIKWVAGIYKKAALFIWDSIKSFGAALWDGNKWVGEKFVDTVSFVWDMYKSFYGAIWDGIKWVADKLIKGFKVAFSFFKGIAKKIVTSAIDAVTSIGTTISSIWDKVVSFIVDGAKGVINKVKKFLHLGGEDEKKPAATPQDDAAAKAVKAAEDKVKLTQENNKNGIVTDAQNKFDFGGKFKSMKGTAEQKLAQVFMDFLLQQYAPYSAELNAAAMNKEDADAMSKVPIRIVEPMR